MQTRKQIGVGSGDRDALATAVSEVRKRQHYAQPGYLSSDERGRKLAILKAFWRRGVGGSACVDQLAATAEMDSRRAKE